MKAYINHLGAANPGEAIKQSAIAEFMCKANHLDQFQSQKLKALYRASGIQQRYSVIEDYASTLPSNFTFYPNSTDLMPFPTVSKRMALYRKHALPLALKAIDNAQIGQQKEGITHLITVSCTGMYAPGLDIELITALQLSNHVKRIGIHFMGCYAAITALKTAASIIQAEPDAQVLVVCLELCSIHFQKSALDDQLLANALFADGAAVALISGKAMGMSLKLEDFHCDILVSGNQDMAWHIGDFGFEMQLSSYVPDLIGSGISDLTHKLLSKLELAPEDVDYWAIHPGGKRILEVIERTFGLTKKTNQKAYEVLANYGNMSSPTVLFVLKSLMDDLTNEDIGKNVLSFAFGPGLTIESMLLKVEY